jgi:hypothetical protein
MNAIGRLRDDVGGLFEWVGQGGEALVAVHRLAEQVYHLCIEENIS